MRVVVMALALTLGSSFAAFAGDDEAAIREVAKNYAAAWSKGDAKAVAALYDTDATLTAADGEMTHSRDAIEKRFVEWFAGQYKGTSIQITMGKPRLLKPDVAVGGSTWEITGMKGPGGEALPPVKGISATTMVKKEGKWLLTAHQTMVPVPPPPSTEKE